ncbi:DUF1415 family protein [Leptolyngbya iicbica]|uniref:DUF1415 family protein n=2 Tax=Cyanophyceae TaxID=3028117 RepID=A0A4Q7EIB7_9CYAN|nr:DUF1415 family protein [Leptolyngbya sp. LK]RZM82798.1 DUF1415 family protein [Leptolyngbya sp. LK]
MSQPNEVVIDAMMAYLREFVEVPHPVFGDLPVCPFARKARLDNTIQFQVYPFTQNEVEPDSQFMELVTDFTRDAGSEILIMIHPRPAGMSLAAMESFVEALNLHLLPLELMAFGGHPEDNFNIQGVYTRRSPYPHLSIQSTPFLNQVTQSLRQTGYYQNWTAADLDVIGFHER